ncbi:MAG: glycosyltransferase family 4 protein [Candidatus Andersenbacteria bacterium]|nr:glycosyltransferase family 4 protein [bacterium]MDZ4225653.1 glycosyltransferase family 4 protein [Candidatus Andersenbacteria bacterium]
MKLLLINNEFPPIGGGGSTVTKYAIKYLVRAGHEVTLVTSQYKDLPKREVIDGAKIIRIPAVRRYKDYCAPWELVTFGVSALVYVFFYSLRHRVDFVQAYFAVPAGWVAWMLKKLRGVPYAVYFGGSDIPNANPSRFARLYPVLTPLLKVVWRGAEFRTVCSHDLIKLAHEADPDTEFLWVPNGVDTARFKPINRTTNPKVKILFIGRLIPRKGFQRVVRALPQVRQQARVPFEVEVVGTGAAKSELDNLAEKIGVSDLIKYVGTVLYEELEKAYQYADIFVLTSLSEGMPSVILEAMGCGLPVVASDVGGNNEIVKEGENGYLIAGDDIDNLARKLVNLIDNADLRRRMGARSRQMAADYDWGRIMARYDEMYRKCKSKSEKLKITPQN